MTEKDRPLQPCEVAEAAFVEDPDLAAYKACGFAHVRTGELIVVHYGPDTERFQLDEDGSPVTLYTGERLDACTLESKGRPYRSVYPEDLGQWWRRQTGQTPASPALKREPHGEGG